MNTCVKGWRNARKGEQERRLFCRRCINSADFARSVSRTPRIWGKKGRTGLPRFFFVRHLVIVVCSGMHVTLLANLSITLSCVSLFRENRTYSYLFLCFLRRESIVGKVSLLILCYIFSRSSFFASSQKYYQTLFLLIYLLFRNFADLSKKEE